MSAWMWESLQGPTPRRRATGNQNLLRVGESDFSRYKHIK